jgi:hypothetical protein
MQVRIRNIKALFLLVLTLTFVSCASQKENVTVVQDPDAKKESQIPWNRQEKWETQAALGGITDRR